MDSGLEENFHDLSRENSLGWHLFDEKSQRPIDERPEWPCLRQIAFEVLRSIPEFKKE